MTTDTEFTLAAVRAALPELLPPDESRLGVYAAEVWCYWIHSQRATWCASCWRTWLTAPDYRQLPLRFDGPDGPA